MRDSVKTARDWLIKEIDRWLRQSQGSGPIESEIRFMRSCTALYDTMRDRYPDLSDDPQALAMLQDIAVEVVRPRTGSRMPVAWESAALGLSTGAAEAVAAARLAAAGQARDALVTTSLMSQGLDREPWWHLPGIPSQLWVLPAVCSALSPDECFAETSLGQEAPPVYYSLYGTPGIMHLRLAYEVRSLRAGLAYSDRELFRRWAFEEFILWCDAHEYYEDEPDETISATLDIAHAERAFGSAAHALGIHEWASDPEIRVKHAREQMYDAQQVLQAAHLCYWAAQESHLLLAADGDDEAILARHPWISQWYPDALTEPSSNPAPLWPPDKGTLLAEMSARTDRDERIKTFAQLQSVWEWGDLFNVESGFAVVTNDPAFRSCDCWLEETQVTTDACGSCGRPAGNRLATRAGGGDGSYPVCRLVNDDGQPHGALAVFSIELALGRGGAIAAAQLIERNIPQHLGTIENHDRLNFCDASTGTDNQNLVVSVSLPPGRYHVIAWATPDYFEALGVYDDYAMQTLADALGDGPALTHA